MIRPRDPTGLLIVLMAVLALVVMPAPGRAEAPTSVPAVSSFQSERPGTSITLIENAGRDGFLIVIAHGDQGLSIHGPAGGAPVWHAETPTRLVAGFGSRFSAYSVDDDGTTLSTYYVGHGGNQVRRGQVQRPSEVAATTLQRSAVAALGPVRFAGQELSSDQRTITFPHPIKAIAAMKGPVPPDFPDGVFAALSPDGKVDLYRLDRIRTALGL